MRYTFDVGVPAVGVVGSEATGAVGVSGVAGTTAVGVPEPVRTGLVVRLSFTMVITVEPVTVATDAPFGVKSTYTWTSIKRLFFETGVKEIEFSVCKKLKGTLQYTTACAFVASGEVK